MAAWLRSSDTWPCCRRLQCPASTCCRISVLHPMVVFSIAFVVIVALAVAAFFQVPERVEAIPVQRQLRQAAVDAGSSSDFDYRVPTTLELTDNTEEATLRTVLFLPKRRTGTPAKKGRR
ncbi:uncharacterized protein LOC144118564 [Amblyomma americanum]